MRKKEKIRTKKKDKNRGKEEKRRLFVSRNVSSIFQYVTI